MGIRNPDARYLANRLLDAVIAKRIAAGAAVAALFVGLAAVFGQA